MLALVLKSYVKGHHRTLPDGRTVFIPPYFTKIVPKGDAPKHARAPKTAPPPKALKHTQTPQRLALRILAHVQDGRMSHDEAEANLAHLERRAHGGHGLVHGAGHEWTPVQVHEFIAHARQALAGHKQHEEKKRATQATEELFGDRPAPPPQGQEQPPPGGQRPARGITQKERQEDWDRRMRERVEREKPAQEKPQGEQVEGEQQELARQKQWRDEQQAEREKRAEREKERKPKPDVPHVVTPKTELENTRVSQKQWPRNTNMERLEARARQQLGDRFDQVRHVKQAWGDRVEVWSKRAMFDGSYQTRREAVYTLPWSAAQAQTYRQPPGQQSLVQRLADQHQAEQEKPPQAKQAPSPQTVDELLLKEHARAWHPFVAEYARLSTQTKAQQALYGGKQVVRQGDLYNIQDVHGRSPWKSMTADDLYLFMMREGLHALVHEADEWRARVMAQTDAQDEQHRASLGWKREEQTKAQEQRIALAVKNLHNVLSSRSVTSAMRDSRIQGLERMAQTGKRLWGGYSKEDVGEIARRLRDAFPTPSPPAKPSETTWQQQERQLRGQTRQHFEDENQRRGRPVARKSWGPALVIAKSYVPGHHRTLPDGRTVFIQPYFTKVIPKGKPVASRRQKAAEAPAKPRPAHHTTPERLALRILAHVQDGRMSHEEAEANLAHLETRAKAGHGLDHGQGQTWDADQVHAFIGHARTALAGHKQQEKRQAKAKKRVVVQAKPKATEEKTPPQDKTQVDQKPPPVPGDSLPGYGQLGVRSRVITATNQVAQTVGRKDIETRFAVVEAPDIIHSFDRRYPQELQPRLERRPGSVDPATEQTVSRMLGNMDFESLTTSRQASQGAPILDQHQHSISGSGRLEALKRMYQQGGKLATDYKQFLQDEAESLGLDSKTIAGMKHPVLTRVITTPLSGDQLAALADEANQRDTQAPSPLSTAVQDSKRLNADILGLLQSNENGDVDLLSRQNAPFREAVLRDVIPPSEHGAVLTQGQWTADGAARLRRAIFARAYGNTPALERLIGSEQVERRNLANSLLAAAPAFTKQQAEIDQGSLHPRSMTADLVDSVNKLVSLSQQGETVQNWLNQSALFDEGLSPLAKDLVNILDMPKFKRSAKATTDLLHAYMEGVYALGDPRQTGMFGATTPPSAAAILAESLERVEQGDTGKQITLLDRKAA